jgi:hypothetical protein
MIKKNTEEKLCNESTCFCEQYTISMDTYVRERVSVSSLVCWAICLFVLDSFVKKKRTWKVVLLCVCFEEKQSESTFNRPPKRQTQRGGRLPPQLPHSHFYTVSSVLSLHLFRKTKVYNVKR